MSRNLLAFADYARAGPFIQDTNSGLYTFNSIYYILYMPLHTWHTLHLSRLLNSMSTAWIYMVELFYNINSDYTIIISYSVI